MNKIWIIITAIAIFLTINFLYYQSMKGFIKESFGKKWFGNNMKLNSFQLFRKPFGEVLNQSESKVIYKDSPDNNNYLAFSHFESPSHNYDICLFNLVNKSNEIIQNFIPLIATEVQLENSWTIDSKYVGIRLAQPYFDLLIYDINNLKACLINGCSDKILIEDVLNSNEIKWSRLEDLIDEILTSQKLK